MDSETAKRFNVARRSTRLAHCPVCGEPNQCRLETGEAYKGPCWCERPVLSGAALQRLLADLPEPRCLCPTCLERIAANPEITWDELAWREGHTHAMPASREGEYYWEGTNLVFTAQHHLRHGYCCRSGCRHCPFDPSQRQR